MHSTVIFDPSVATLKVPLAVINAFAANNEDPMHASKPKRRVSFFMFYIDLVTSQFKVIVPPGVIDAEVGLHTLKFTLLAVGYETM